MKKIDEDEGHERPGGEAAAEQEDAEHRGDRRRAEVGGADHRFAADGVEESAEDERAEEVRDGEERDVERNRPRGDFEEFAEQGAEVEGDGVVEERLADEQGEPERGAAGVFGERGAGDLPEPDPLARAGS